MIIQTPILLMFFNREEPVVQVMNSIRMVRPSRLFLAADGPRLAVDGEFNKCQRVREIVDSMIDWECEVHRLYRDNNLGCGRGPSEAITWFFEHVEEGIILEDDCVPLISFYPYCKNLLEKYRTNEDVMHISGTTFVDNSSNIESYFFSKFSIGWGWATWKRAWSKFSFEINETDSEIKLNLQKYLNSHELNYWMPRLLQLKYYNENDIWDVQWSYTLLKNKRFSIIPSLNLVNNIGFSDDATHTKVKLYNNDNYTVDMDEIKHTETIELSAIWDNHPFQEKQSEISSLNIYEKNILKYSKYLPSRLSNWIIKKYFNKIAKYIQFSEFQFVNYAKLISSIYGIKSFSIMELGIWRGSVALSFAKLFNLNHVLLIKDKDWQNVLFSDFDDSSDIERYNNPKKSAWYRDHENNMPFWIFELGYLSNFDGFRVKKNFENIEEIDFVDICIINSIFYSTTYSYTSELLNLSAKPNLILLPTYSLSNKKAIDILTENSLYILKNINNNFYLILNEK
ncbi:MAG: hypothetical protein WCK02_16585 [Bacteroidota bacterium]